MMIPSADTPGPGRSVAGRHVLGSSPETLEPVTPASAPPPPEDDGALRAAEPARTIYVDWWADARARVEAMEPVIGAPLAAALHHVEAGWEHVRELQRWHDDNRERALGEPDDYAEILNFIDGDLVDVFREIAAGVAGLVPGYASWADEADPGSVDGDLDVFRRYLTVFTLAVEQAPGAEPLRVVSRAVARGLAGWCAELEVLVTAVDAVLGPGPLADADL